jgi:hypothetical protein
MVTELQRKTEMPEVFLNDGNYEALSNAIVDSNLRLQPQRLKELQSLKLIHVQMVQLALRLAIFS